MPTKQFAIKSVSFSYTGSPVAAGGNRALVTSSGQSKAVRPLGRTTKRKFLFPFKFAEAMEFIELSVCKPENALQ